MHGLKLNPLDKPVSFIGLNYNILYYNCYIIITFLWFQFYNITDTTRATTCYFLFDHLKLFLWFLSCRILLHTCFVGLYLIYHSVITCKIFSKFSIFLCLYTGSGITRTSAPSATPLCGGTGPDGRERSTGWHWMESICLWLLPARKPFGKKYV